MLALASALLTLAGSQYGLVDRGSYWIAYESMGKGKPIVMIPGGPGFAGRAVWGAAYELEDKMRCILFDQLGTGRSQMKSKGAAMPLSMANTLADLEALRKQLGYRKWSVFGQSWGAIVAVSYAAYYPDSVDRLVVTSVPGFNSSDALVLQTILDSKIPKEVHDQIREVSQRDDLTQAKKFEQSSYLMLPYYFYNVEYGRSLQQHLPPEAMNGEVFLGLIGEASARALRDLPELLKQWKGEALIIQGHNDVTGGAMGYRLKEILPNSRVQMFTLTGHFTWIESPDYFAFCVRDFFGFSSKPEHDITMSYFDLEENHKKYRLARGWPFGIKPKAEMQPKPGLNTIELR